MATGYTSMIGEGASFEKFVLRCARAMGALIMMRDDPWDAPIPERFEPSDYHARALAEAQKRLAQLQAMTEAEAEAEARKAHRQVVASVARSRKKDLELRAKYEAMLKQVRAWKPPTVDHRGLKNFMLEQIESSLAFDCSESAGETDMPAEISAKEWRSDRIAEAKRDIAYHTKEHAAEVSRTEERNEWIAALRRSLGKGRRP